MNTSQSCIIDTRARVGDESCRVRATRGRIRNKRIKPMNTPRELKALISYLRQQEAEVLNAMQRLRDAP